uniref:Uncharacterized protein n=2 Tax=Oryza sativa subsp. japonica TaxID=39947 RepID=A0A5S6R9X3_ORYSJ|nr:Hypothetical protein [Oryza sativa Japonica Group]AAN34965.1 Hypothetical protein [Oryza sativa Japonica Group]AAP53092.1 hypothetical protein LOC_Os10g19100 [Oryza sativa Japonica Group]
MEMVGRYTCRLAVGGEARRIYNGHSPSDNDQQVDAGIWGGSRSNGRRHHGPLLGSKDTTTGNAPWSCRSTLPQAPSVAPPSTCLEDPPKRSQRRVDQVESTLLRRVVVQVEEARWRLPTNGTDVGRGGAWGGCVWTGLLAVVAALTGGSQETMLWKVNSRASRRSKMSSVDGR